MEKPTFEKVIRNRTPDQSPYLIPELQTLPSGVIVQICEWSFGDISKMTSNKSATRSLAMNGIIKRCVLKDDPLGVYEGKLRVDQNLVPSLLFEGDRIALIVLTRIYSHGIWIDFDFDCQNYGCQETIEYSIDARRIMLPNVFDPDASAVDVPDFEFVTYEEVRDTGEVVSHKACNIPALGEHPVVLSDERIYFAGITEETAITLGSSESTFQHTDRNGNLVCFRLLRGKDERETLAHDSSELKINSVVDRIVYVRRAGEDREISKPKQIRKFVENWAASDADKFLKEYEARDFGIEMDIDVCCPACGTSQTIGFPMGSEGFLSPNLRRKKSRRV